MRIIRNAKEDLHDTVFLELDNGFTVDLASVQFLDGADADPLRTEFHFPRTRGCSPRRGPRQHSMMLPAPPVFVMSA